MGTFWLWLQFAYAIWQFVRVAKFFRIPSALCYHTLLWLVNRAERPFSVQTFSLVQQGTKWTASSDDILQPEDVDQGGGYYVQRRHGATYLADAETVRYINMVDRLQPKFLCSNVDLIVPNFYILDVYHWPEGMHEFLKEGSALSTTTGHVLAVSSREHFLNQNFMRLLSIFPLMLQAKGFDSESIYASIAIIILDQVSYPANIVWRAFQDLLVDLGSNLISKIRGLKTRLFISTFLSTITPRLRFRDQVVRNFYYVRKNEHILLAGTSRIDYFDDIHELEPPSELNPYKQLSEEDYYSLVNVHGDVEQYFGITVGTMYLEHHISGACIKTFLCEKENAYFNFIDNEHLHYGMYSQNMEFNIRKALKWIENNGKMPVKCNYAGELAAVAFNVFVDSVGQGQGVISFLTVLYSVDMKEIRYIQYACINLGSPLVPPCPTSQILPCNNKIRVEKLMVILKEKRTNIHPYQN